MHGKTWESDLNARIKKHTTQSGKRQDKMAIVYEEESGKMASRCEKIGGAQPGKPEQAGQREQERAD